MHYIFIEDLEIDCVVGVYAHERVQRQTLRFDIEVGIRNAGGFQSDNLEETVDYAAVAQLVRDELSATSFKLLERLADHLAGRIAAEFDANRVKLRIAKGAIVPGARRVGVVLERTY
jgi:dihydroneopterin aldolase